MMATMSTEWKYGNQHVPNRYSKASLIKESICRLYRCYSPRVMIYLPLSLASTTTSWTKETRKPQPFHDKNIQKYPLPLQKYPMARIRKRQRVRPRQRSGAAHDGGQCFWKQRCHGHCLLIVLIVQLWFQITIFLIIIKLGKWVRFNNKIQFIQSIRTHRFKILHLWYALFT